MSLEVQHNVTNRLDLECVIIEKDVRIAALEFELHLQKKSYELLNETFLKLLRI